MMGSAAAAHGCGSAFVQRTARVGTGRRLHVLVLQFRKRGRPEEPSVAGSTPAEHTRNLQSGSRLLSGNGKHASPVRRRSGFDSPGRLDADVAQLVEHDVAIAEARVRVPSSAPCDRSVSGSARDFAKVLGRVRISSVTLARICGHMRRWRNGRRASPRN
jgi:hypothetical protein